MNKNENVIYRWQKDCNFVQREEIMTQSKQIVRYALRDYTSTTSGFYLISSLKYDEFISISNTSNPLFNFEFQKKVLPDLNIFDLSYLKKLDK